MSKPWSDLVHYWVPVEVVQRGYARVLAHNEQEAHAYVESGEVGSYELVGLEVHRMAPTGPPSQEHSV